MAYSRTASRESYRLIQERALADYKKLETAETTRLAKEAQQAGETAVKFKAGETVFDLTEKAYFKKNKAVMGKSFPGADKTFEEMSYLTSGGDEINLFTKESTTDMPLVGDFLGQKTVQVNPSAYESIGRSLVDANPHLVTDVKNVKPGVYESIGKTYTPKINESSLTSAIVHSPDPHTSSSLYNTEFTLGKEMPWVGKGTSKISGGERFGNLKLSEDIVDKAGELVGAESKLMAEMGTIGKFGKYLGPVTAGYSMLKGGYDVFDPESTGEEKAVGAVSATGGAVALGTSTAVTAGLVEAGILTAEAAGATQAWNPVGWALLGATGLYEVGKFAGLWGQSGQQWGG